MLHAFLSFLKIKMKKKNKPSSNCQRSDFVYPNWTNQTRNDIANVVDGTRFERSINLRMNGTCTRQAKHSTRMQINRMKSNEYASHRMYINWRKINSTVLCILVLSLCRSVAILVLVRVRSPLDILHWMWTHKNICFPFCSSDVFSICWAIVFASTNEALTKHVGRTYNKQVCKWCTHATRTLHFAKSLKNLAQRIVAHSAAPQNGICGRRVKTMQILIHTSVATHRKHTHTQSHRFHADSVFCPMHKCRSLASNRQRFIMWNFTFYASVPIAFNKKREGDDCVQVMACRSQMLYCNARCTARTVWGTFRARSKNDK